MQGRLASPRFRRRLLWLGGGSCVTVVVVLVSIHLGNTGHSQATPVDKTKNRLLRVIEHECALVGSDELTKLGRATIEAAQSVKHNLDGTRMRAGLAPRLLATSICAGSISENAAISGRMTKGVNTVTSARMTPQAE